MCDRARAKWAEMWGLLCPFPLGGAGSSSNTMSHGPRPTSVPSGILIHPAVWPQQTWDSVYGRRLACVRKLRKWGSCCVSLSVGRGRGGAVSHLTQYGLDWGLLPYSGILIHSTVWPQYTTVTGVRSVSVLINKKVFLLFTEVITSCTNRNGGLLRSLSVKTDLRISCPSISCVFFKIAESINCDSAILIPLLVLQKWRIDYIKLSIIPCIPVYCTKSQNKQNHWDDALDDAMNYVSKT